MAKKNSSTEKQCSICSCNSDTLSDALIGVTVIAGIAALISLLSKNE